MEIKPCNYFVCLIDIMGQKEFFKDIKSPDVSDDIKKNIERVSNGLAEMVRYATNRYTRLFKGVDVGVELFSDSIIFSLKETSDKPSYLSVWLEMIVKVVYIACKYRLPFRGSIVKGLAQRSDSGTIYGDAVDEVIDIEQNITDSFRIVFSKELALELESKHSTEYRRFCERDADFALILNYAGYRIIEKNEFLKERMLLKDIVVWVKERFDYFCYQGTEEHDQHANPKLARRFKMWGEYLELESARKAIERYV